jgi:8-oxo-dGTP pyrophosphatase MutT (NUDIX family)
MAKTSHDSATPAHGQQVISACAFIHADFDGVKKVFLSKRADTKKFLPGLYELPGGHIDFGEDIADGLRREIQEELGMEVRLGDPFAVFTYENTVKGSHSVEVVYFGQFVGPLEAIRIRPDDHSRFDWFTRDEVMARRAEMVPVGQAVHKNEDQDAEYKAVLRGFELLEGASLRVGTAE